MSHLLLIGLVAAVTLASRLSFMLRRPPEGSVKDNRFLEVFPAALFTALAVHGFVAPAGDLDLGPAIAGGIAGVAGAAVFKRSILGVIGLGLIGYWAARWLGGL